MSLRRLSISVVIACDRAPGNFQRATAIRGVLESFGIQVYFYRLIHKQNLLDFLAGNYPDCDYIIWYCYGRPSPNGEEQINFQVIDQQDNDYTSKSGWEETSVSFTPSTVSQYVTNPQGTLICGAASGEKWSESFLALGYQAYIAATLPDLACNSHTLFITGFFYYLLMHTLDYTDRQFTPQEAVIAAASMDRHYEYGTKLFHYYRRIENN